jgi:hypothetical protein
VSDAAYVFGGWALTAAALAGYAARVWARSRRARRLGGTESGRPWT